MTAHRDVVVIGAGQAGLATSYYLTAAGCDYVALDSDSDEKEEQVRQITSASEDGENRVSCRSAGTDKTESGSVRTNDIETFYVRRGDGPTIVFIHGMAMSADQWKPQMAALSDEYTTIAYDVRGHGHTGGSDREPYTMELYAADLDVLLTALDIENPVLCGLSMGGCIAQMYAARYPERVAGLVVSDTFTAAPLPLKGRFIFANLRFFGRLDRFIGGTGAIPRPSGRGYAPSRSDTVHRKLHG